MLDTDTTYTNGSGLSLIGTAFSILYGTDLLGWTNLTNYPTACLAGETITDLADTITCTAISIQAGQVSDFFANVYTGIENYFDQEAQLNTTGSPKFVNINLTVNTINKYLELLYHFLPHQ